LPWRKAEQHPAAPDPLENCIILPSGRMGLYESAERAFRILSKSETLFIRGGRVFELAKSDNGLLKLDVMIEQTFRSRIQQHDRVVAYRAGPHGEELLKADARCSFDTAAAWLASDAKNLLPRIAAIHNCAIIAEGESGIEVLGKGYHRTCGGRLIVGGEMPHRMELAEAVEILLEIVAEYEFATPADKSRAIACLLRPAMRFGGLFGGAHIPLFVVEADDSQAGKGFFTSKTFRTWIMDDPELADRFHEARERGRVNALSILQQAAKEDWRAAAEWLRLAHRESYSTRAEISVEGAPKQDEGIVMDAVMLTRLQGAYQQTLESIHRQEPDKQNGSENDN
jgi:hypothetical protein